MKLILQNNNISCSSLTLFFYALSVPYFLPIIRHKKIVSKLKDNDKIDETYPKRLTKESKESPNIYLA